MQNVLLAEADEDTLRARGDELLLDGYEPLVARSAKHARHLLADHHPEALILGELESGAHSLALLRDLRAGAIGRADPNLAVLSIGADSDHAAVRHYQAGADLSLPTSASPLLVRQGLQTLANRIDGRRWSRPRVLRVGALQVDCDERTARLGDTPIKLTRREFDVLQTLASRPGQVCTRELIYKEVWGYPQAPGSTTRTLDAHAYRLRQTLRDHGAEGLLESVRGVGYRLTR